VLPINSRYLVGLFLAAVGWLPSLTLNVAAAAAPNTIAVELNKLEPNGKGCRAYVVIDNPGDTAYSVFKVELILFRTDGVIDRRLALDIGPLRAHKKFVKTFDLDTPPCDGIGSVLVNDVLDCKTDTIAVADCLDLMTVSSRASAPLTK
jgi:hypothetical protein